MSGAPQKHHDSKTVVVIGNGMVGQRLCETLVACDTQRQYSIVTFCEEPRAAYDRVGLTSFFAHRSAEKLLLAKRDWYIEHGIELHIGDRASQIDRQARVVRSDKGVQTPYDVVVLATGSYPFVPPVPGIDTRGVFVYRTIEDLEKIMDYGKRAKRAAVIGGGLLGLEAAKATHDLGLETHVIEFAPRLMPRQIDDAGSRLLVDKLTDLGVHVHLNTGTKEVLGQGRVEGMLFTDGKTLEVDMIIVSAGIRPRDDLAKASGLAVGERGGVIVDTRLRTSDPQIYAIGEVALVKGMIYGLVAPGWQMADTVAKNLTGGDECFEGADLSTKLKLMGVDVASFGDYEAGPERARALTWEDPFAGVYKKLLFNHAGTHLLGGVLVGDAHDYGVLAAIAKGGGVLPCKPHELLMGKSGSTAVVGGVAGLPDSAQICSCNNVTKGAICSAIRDQELSSIGAVKSATKAGTGCGGCLPLLTDLLQTELRSAGKTVSHDLCEHFAHSRTDLFALIKVQRLQTFDAVLAEHGRGAGCEVCKPAITSILASLWNEHILEPAHQTLQDTNDRMLANMQRGGLYSVVPRVPGGEITPDKLIALGQTAQQFGLYTKITGAQRIDLFGAQAQDLPSIWGQLVQAGFESGHAYGKALRTVKSCVGTTWCRYGVQDSVGFAVRVENRYKGVRAPHKIKAAVSGCIRECAEAQSKDFGLVATERGYNLYVCGNGGARPRHADLLATDLDEETALRYIDRFLMYYIMTADRLTRTAVWIDKLEGGIEHLKDVVIHDTLGIGADLDAMMQALVDTYQCEWAAVVKDPSKRKWFRQFVNTENTEPGIEMIVERGQRRPGNWPSEETSLLQLDVMAQRTRPAAAQLASAPRTWVHVGTTEDFPQNGGATIQYGKTQIAVFHFTTRGAWYACQQMCPHKKAFVLSRGILGDSNDVPKVACPLHKKTFALTSGACLSGEDYTVQVFPVRVVGADVYLELPPAAVLDGLLATDIGCSLATACDSHPVALAVAP